MIPTRLNDYVIVGGGLCGCVLAHELSLRTDRDIWMIEAGGDQPENASDRARPGRWLHLLGSTDDAWFSTTPNEHVAGRQIVWPRGRGLGGSGRINAMIWIPPHPRDIESLVDVGLDHELLRRSMQRADELITTESPRYLSPSSQQVLSGLDRQTTLGQFSAYQRINQNGRRWTTEELIQTVRQTRPGQLKVINANVSKLHLDGGQVTSLELESSTHRPTYPHRVELTNDAHLISCAGALGTPRLLMQSGMRIEELGDNLHDHLIMPVVFQRTGERFLPASPTTRDIAAWQHCGVGPLTSNIAECGGFDPEFRFQWHITPTDYLRYPSPKAGSALTLGVSLTRPRSRGTVRVSGSELVIDNGYLSDDRDVADLVEGVQRTRQMADRLRESGMQIKETVPGPRRQSDAQVAASISRYATTLYHPAGTCAIGPVVDEQMRVLGLNNLSVVDASVVPQPTTANPTAVLAMLACYAAAVL